jgi:lysophospholipase L1-like esterase
VIEPLRRLTRGLGFYLAIALLLGSCAEVARRPASGQDSAAAASGIAQTGVRSAALTPPTLTAAPLTQFFGDLRRLQSAQIEHVRILQLGDSHTAGDYFTATLRGDFQEKFGDAGRGMMPPGLAYPGLRQSEVKVTQTGRWTIHNSLTERARGPYGISGFSATSGKAGAGMSVTPTNPSGFDSASVDYLERPGGGNLEVWLDGRLIKSIPTGGIAGRPRRAVINAPDVAHSLQLVARSAGITILDWSIDRRQRGVQLVSFGVVGATVNVIDHWSPEIIEENLAAIRPSLVVLAFGTNEGFESDFDPAAYREAFSDVVARLKRGAPEASILVIGPPDGERAEPHCHADCRWTTPPALAQVRAIQRRVADAAGVAFWDWSQVMAPDGGIDAWVHADPPLARGDHVHFTAAGYERAATNLFDQLSDLYQQFPAEDAPSKSKRKEQSPTTARRLP